MQSKHRDEQAWEQFCDTVCKEQYVTLVVSPKHGFLWKYYKAKQNTN